MAKLKLKPLADRVVIKPMEAEVCQVKIPRHSLFSFINFCELSAILVINVSSDIFGDRETRK